MVWGARTLAGNGNGNEWGYVPVRRFFNMVGASCVKSTVWAVFEPNDADPWTKLKGMIDYYLSRIEGRPATGLPEGASFREGRARGYLERRLIIEIAMALVRPAEFIILQFVHEMPGGLNPEHDSACSTKPQR